MTRRRAQRTPSAASTSDAAPRAAINKAWRLRILVAALLVLGVAAYPASIWLRWRASVESARKQLEVGEFSAAIESLALAERTRPDQPETHFLLARAYRRAGSAERFAAHLKRAGQLGWSEEDLALQSSMAACQAGDVNARERILAARDSAPPDDIAEEIYETLAQSYMMAFEVEQAGACLDHWLSWRPQRRQALLWRADLAQRIGNEAAARRDLEAVLQQAPTHAEAAAALANLQLESNEVQDAADVLAVALAAHGDHVELRLLAAQAARRLTQWEEAQAHARRAGELATESHEKATAEYELGQVQLAKGNHAQAVDAFQIALRSDPSSGRLHHALSMAYGLAGQRELSQKHLARGREIDAQDQRFLDLLQKVQQDPNDHASRAAAAEILEARGSLTQAIRWREIVVSQRPDAASHAALARMYRAQGRDQLAAAHAARAEVLESDSAKPQEPSS